jgi:signal transduction histidine kinase
MYESWKKQEPYLLYELAGQVNIDHNKYLAETADNFPIPSEQLLAILPPVTFSNSFNFRYGYLLVVSLAAFTKEHCSFISRFAKVFEQTYTRFLDLKKAEAQALQAEQDLVAIKEAKQKAEEALTELQATQKQLIQAEKMASLGELTAGIAHEIQNPLNFVNNFSEVSKELLDEMKEAIEKGDTEDAKEIMSDVIQNLEKINHHGKRADGIVKGMLQHSRSSSGQKESTDINALCDEYLRLSYHGLRAKDKSFNAKFETHLDETVGKLNIIPQDMGRVVLNLINNAFYAVSERKKLNEPGYEPTVSVSTIKDGDSIKIKVSDNGTGIPQKVLDKIFQPFFTTKPTGQGTGLGLSLSYDIVTKGHGGELKVETKEGEGSIFTILLPMG